MKVFVDGRTNRPLTKKQELFCQVYVETKSARKAYRTVYGKSVDNAYFLLQRTKVEARIKELKANYDRCKQTR